MSASSDTATAATTAAATAGSSSAAPSVRVVTGVELVDGDGSAIECPLPAPADVPPHGQYTKRRVLLLRHGERIDAVDPQWKQTAENPDDPPLTPAGHLSARMAARTVAAARTPGRTLRVFASPFTRTVQTAVEVVSELRRMSPDGDVDIVTHIEYGCSEWLRPTWFKTCPLQRLTFAHTDPAAVTVFNTDESMKYRDESIAQPRHPERFASDFYARTARCAQTLAMMYDEDDLLLITHGAGIEGLGAALVEGFIPGHLYWAPYCSLSIIDEDTAVGRYRLVHPRMPWHRDTMPCE